MEKDGIDCIFPHAYIHYENKLRTKQFFERCTDIIGLDMPLMSLAVEQYDKIVADAGEIA